MRTYTRELKPGKHVVKGWISQIRDLGGLKFFLLRDREGLVQITLKKGKVPEKLLQAASGLGKEDCVEVSGKVQKSDRAPGGLEIIPDKILLVSKAKTPLPIEIDGKTGKDKRFDYRFLDMRNPKIQAVFRIRDKILTVIRDYLEGNDFVEVHTPVIHAAGAEGGATLFPIIYYQKPAFLRQSPQLYKQILMASGLDRVYEIGHVFRAEKFHTRRHVSEYISLDSEMAWIDSEEDVLKILESMILSVFKGIRKECRIELSILGIKVTLPKIPFKRITYDHAVRMLEKIGEKVTWGEDLQDPQERKLGDLMAKTGDDWFFITKYPSQIKPFYIMMEGKLSRGIDMSFRGLEIASGGQREHRYDQLVSAMKQKKLDASKFDFYLNSFRYGMPPHGGFGLGFDRLVQAITGLENVKETILFPRTPENLVP